MKSKQSLSLKGRLFSGLSLTIVSFGLAACGTPGNGEFTTGPTLTDQAFGDSVRSARAMQTIDVDAGTKHGNVAGTDGTTAGLALERYRNTYRNPEPKIQVLGIGSGDN
ncbi:MAG: hypothetical protein AB8C46_13385 [Burkholderiaceae bacterium]